MRWKLKDKSLWHPWFAWFPIRLGNYRVWWETLMRQESCGIVYIREMTQDERAAHDSAHNPMEGAL